MPSGKAIRAARAFVELFTDDTKLVRGLRAAEMKLKRFGAQIAAMGRSMMMMGTAMLAPLLGAAKVFSSLGDQMGKMAKRTGFSAESLSELSFAASQSGTDIDSLEKSLARMQRSIYDAGRGLSTAVDALADLGLAFADLNSLSPDKQFELMADRLSQIEDPTKKAAVAMTLFGRSGTALLPMIAGGAQGIDALRKKARDLGLVLGSEDVKAAEKFTDAMDVMWKVVKIAVFQVGAALAPAMTKASQEIVKAAGGVRKWVVANSELIVTLLKVAACTVALSVALVVIGKIVAAVGVMIAVFRGVVVAIKAISVALAFLSLHPLILALTAIVAVVAVAVYAFRRLSSAARELSAAQDELLSRGDKQRVADIEQMKRLEQLAAKERLNSNEMAEAGDLIKTLTDRYGDLGIRLDKITGKFYGVAAAQNKVSEEMRRAARDQIIAAIHAKDQEIRDLAKKRDPNILFQNVLPADEARRKAKVDLRIAAVTADRDMLLARLRQLAEGSSQAVTGKERSDRFTASNLAAAQEASDNEEAIKKAADLEAEWARKLYRLKLEQIEDERARAAALINDEYNYEIAQARRAGANAATIADMNQARAIDLFNVRKKAEADIAAETKNRLDEQARRQDEINAVNRDEQYTIAELRLRTQYKGQELEKKLLDLQERRALLAAKESGADMDLVRREYNLRRQMMDVSTAPARQASVGTFNPASLLSLQSSTNYQKQTADSVKQVADNTAAMRRDLERFNLSFS